MEKHNKQQHEKHVAEHHTEQQHEKHVAEHHTEQQNLKNNDDVKKDYFIPIAIVIAAIIIALSGRYGGNNMRASNTQTRSIQQQTSSVQNVPQTQQIAPQGGGGCGV